MAVQTKEHVLTLLQDHKDCIRQFGVKRLGLVGLNAVGKGRISVTVGLGYRPVEYAAMGLAGVFQKPLARERLLAVLKARLG